jgi:hypothetical protein
MTEETQATPKIPRAKWSDSQILRLQANKNPDGAAIWLLNALVSLNVAHGTVDLIVGAETGTTMAFLKTDKDQPGLTTEQVDKLLILLAALHTEGAFTSKGLDVAATLRVMMRGGS